MQYQRIRTKKIAIEIANVWGGIVLAAHFFNPGTKTLTRYGWKVKKQDGSFWNGSAIAAGW